MFFCRQQWFSFPRHVQRMKTWPVRPLFFKSSRSAVRIVFAAGQNNMISVLCMDCVRAGNIFLTFLIRCWVLFLSSFCFALISGAAEHGPPSCLKNRHFRPRPVLAEHSVNTWVLNLSV